MPRPQTQDHIPVSTYYGGNGNANGTTVYDRVHGTGTASVTNNPYTSTAVDGSGSGDTPRRPTGPRSVSEASSNSTAIRIVRPTRIDPVYGTQHEISPYLRPRDVNEHAHARTQTQTPGPGQESGSENEDLQLDFRMSMSPADPFAGLPEGVFYEKEQGSFDLDHDQRAALEGIAGGASSAASHLDGNGIPYGHGPSGYGYSSGSGVSDAGPDLDFFMPTIQQSGMGMDSTQPQDAQNYWDTDSDNGIIAPTRSGQMTTSTDSQQRRGVGRGRVRGQGRGQGRGSHGFPADFRETVAGFDSQVDQDAARYYQQS